MGLRANPGLREFYRVFCDQACVPDDFDPVAIPSVLYATPGYVARRPVPLLSGAQSIFPSSVISVIFVLHHSNAQQRLRAVVSLASWALCGEWGPKADEAQKYFKGPLQQCGGVAAAAAPGLWMKSGHTVPIAAGRLEAFAEAGGLVRGHCAVGFGASGSGVSTDPAQVRVSAAKNSDGGVRTVGEEAVTGHGAVGATLQWPSNGKPRPLETLECGSVPPVVRVLLEERVLERAVLPLLRDHGMAVSPKVEVVVAGLGLLALHAPSLSVGVCTLSFCAFVSRC